MQYMVLPLLYWFPCFTSYHVWWIACIQELVVILLLGERIWTIRCAWSFIQLSSVGSLWDCGSASYTVAYGQSLIAFHYSAQNKIWLLAEDFSEKVSCLKFFNLISMIALLGIAAVNDADFFSSIGKIYVVVAVIAIIFVGIVLYLRRLDVKATKLEEQLNNGKT